MNEPITISLDRDFSNAYGAVERISRCGEFDKFTIAYCDSMRYTYNSRLKAIRDILFAKRIFDLAKKSTDNKNS